MEFEARLTELNKNEVLMYLGYRGQELDADLESQIGRCIDEVRQASNPRLVYVRVPVVDGNCEGFDISGNDMTELLANCDEAIIFAATLGNEIERALMQREVRNMADALIMDSCASTAVENICNNFEADVREALLAEGLYLSSRFSPGYGDLPLESQKSWCSALNTARRIGLNVADNYLLMPRKSVTAIMGISEKPITLRKSGCEICKMFRNCKIRKDGKVCNE